MARDSDKKRSRRGLQTTGDNYPLVYLGPNLIGGLYLANGTIYKSGLPARLAEVVKADKDLSSLFVPVAGLATARRQLADEHSSLTLAAMVVARRYGRTKE